MAGSGVGIYLVPRDPSAIATARGSRKLGEVAAAAEVSPALLSQLAHGHACRVSAAVASRIEDALGVQRGSLFALNPDDAELLTSYGLPA